MISVLADLNGDQDGDQDRLILTLVSFISFPPIGLYFLRGVFKINAGKMRGSLNFFNLFPKNTIIWRFFGLFIDIFDLLRFWETCGGSPHPAKSLGLAKNQRTLFVDFGVVRLVLVPGTRYAILLGPGLR